MSKQSIFRSFIGILKKRLRAEFPTVRPIEETFDPMMPKASTFYAGVAGSSGSHVFFHFQHSPKAWEVGNFTINVIVSPSAKPKWPDHQVVFPDDARSIREGTYRIGPLLGGKDKWWQLKKNNTLTDDPVFDELYRKLEEIFSLDENGCHSRGTDAWLPMSYDDDTSVCNEAATDVIHDLRRVLRFLGVPESA